MRALALPMRPWKRSPEAEWSTSASPGRTIPSATRRDGSQGWASCGATRGLFWEAVPGRSPPPPVPRGWSSPHGRRWDAQRSTMHPKPTPRATPSRRMGVASSSASHGRTRGSAICSRPRMRRMVGWDGILSGDVQALSPQLARPPARPSPPHRTSPIAPFLRTTLAPTTEPALSCGSMETFTGVSPYRSAFGATIRVTCPAPPIAGTPGIWIRRWLADFDSLER
mmetsp:Transcript_25337/g.60904  ORF Transcript_25337/g.60904 Transcript_25337/m.60904 type:complete len:225 (+) Transcript_25337:1498-2172(+)